MSPSRGGGGFTIVDQLSELVRKFNKFQRECTKLFVLCSTNRDHAHCFVLRVNPNVSAG